MCCRSFLLGPCVAIEMILKRWSGAGDMRLRARGLMSLQASSVVGISDQRLRGSFEGSRTASPGTRVLPLGSV